MAKEQPQHRPTHVKTSKKAYCKQIICEAIEFWPMMRKDTFPLTGEGVMVEFENT